ncbi:MAG: 2-oxo acid dehydrogenase subunit E2 [Gammaproteobacteria bacterium]|nr:2-oxo acid dehydrogenase subunit E2 [Gammaproteobacteria bacterium]MCH9763516.1 2-oxo acid dehydrogenase subunit E2 [Gammaproteobacteria bacterium]
MTVFNLPDLGEGLPDAEIHEWFVKEGDTVAIDQPLVSMETAKAVVDVPCPEAGIIGKLFGQPGDIIKTGDPLAAFTQENATTSEDKGTVVGTLLESTENFGDDFIIGSADASTRVKATPAARLRAKKLNLDLKNIIGTGASQLVTIEDVELEAKKQATPPEGFEPLRGVRRAMLNSMVESHETVVPVSIFDEADVSAWVGQDDISIRLIRAICAAAKTEPALNAWFNTQHSARKCFDEVHLGLAMDNADGLFVPVIHNAESQTDTALREQINAFKISVQDRTVPADKLTGSTITLSNFGKFSGRFASPIIVPPSVSILAVGRLYEGVQSNKGDIRSCHLLPLSLSFDHRAVTGGEATRFLGAIIASLK